MSTFCQSRVQRFPLVLMGVCTFCPVTFSQHRESTLYGEFLSGATREIFSSTWTGTSGPRWFFQHYKASPSKWLLPVSTERADMCSPAALSSHQGSTTFFCYLVPQLLQLQNGETQYLKAYWVHVQCLVKSLAHEWIINTSYHYYYCCDDFVSFLLTWNISPSWPLSGIWYYW